MEEIFPGLTREWLFDDRVVSYTPYSPKKPRCLPGANPPYDTFETWPREQPYLAIHDISQSGIGLFYCAAVKNDIFNIGVIPEAHKRVDDILEHDPDCRFRLHLWSPALYRGSSRSFC